MRFTTITLVLMFVLSSIAFANPDYNETGYFNADFVAGVGVWNENIDAGNLTFYTKTLSEQIRTPLVSDLDNDGVKEIIVLSDTSLIAYNGKNLQIQDSISVTGDSSEDYSNILAYDIDGDGFTEIIFMNQKGKLLKIYKYNSGTWTENVSSSITISVTPNPEMMIKCKGVNNCLIVSSSGRAISGAGSQSIHATPFNSSEVINSKSITLEGVSIAGKGWCLPNIRTMEIAKLTDLGEDLYFASALKYRETADEEGTIFAIRQNSSNDLTLMLTTARSNGFLSGHGSCTSSNLGQYITNPIVFDFDSAESGNEILFGFQKDLDEFRIYAQDYQGNAHDEFPESSDADGIIISNLARGTFFSESTDDSVCVLGFDTIDSLLDLTCASKNAGTTPETREYSLTLTSGLNFTSSYQKYNTLIHSVQYSNELTDGSNLNEVLSSLGTLKLQESTCSILGNCDLERTFTLESTPNGDNTIIPIDYDDLGIDDLLMTTSTNILYLDDGFSKSDAIITSYTFNPCVIDAVVKLNSSVQVSVEVTDDNGENIPPDEVSARVLGYYGGTNEQDSGFTSNSTSGTTFQFFFNANETSTNSVIRMIGKDADSGVEDVIEQNFAVGQNGVQFGDSTCSVDAVAEAEAQAGVDSLLNTTAIDLQDNAVRNIVDDYNGFFKLGALGTFILLLMALNIYLIYRNEKSMFNNPQNMKYTLLALMIIDTLAVILGVLTGIVPFGVVVVLVLVGIISAVVWGRSFLTRQGGL